MPGVEMDLQRVDTLITFIGIVSQTAASALLILLFVILGNLARRRSYFIRWGQAWVVLTISLTALLLRSLPDLAPQFAWLQSSLVQLSELVYQAGKIIFFVLLLIGSLQYSRGIHFRHFSWLLAAALVYALVSVLTSDRVRDLLLWQVPVAVGCSFYAGWLLMRLPLARSSLGSRATGVLLLALGALWLVYAHAFLTAPPPTEYAGAPVSFLARYSSYLDALLQLLLAFGMVRLLLEDSKRETDAAHAELAIAHQRLMTESLKDALTGVMNRRAYMEGLGLENVLSGSGTVAVLDLDNLKEVNDTHGHSTGDRMLQHFAAILRHGLRPSDKLYRWGGDEFLVLLPGASPDDARERLHRLLSGAEPLFVGGQRLDLGVSLGCAPYAPGGTPMEVAINHADTDMYGHKRSRKSGGGKTGAKSPKASPATNA